MSLNPAGRTTIGVGLADRGRRILGDIPLIAGSACKAGPKRLGYYCLLFPDMVAGHYKCSLPAQFPMNVIDGLGSSSCKTGDSRKDSSATVRCAEGRLRTNCAIDATVAGAVLR